MKKLIKMMPLLGIVFTLMSGCKSPQATSGIVEFSTSGYKRDTLNQYKLSYIKDSVRLIEKIQLYIDAESINTFSQTNSLKAENGKLVTLKNTHELYIIPSTLGKFVSISDDYQLLSVAFEKDSAKLTVPFRWDGRKYVLDGDVETKTKNVFVNQGEESVGEAFVSQPGSEKRFIVFELTPEQHTHRRDAHGVSVDQTQGSGDPQESTTPTSGRGADPFSIGKSSYGNGSSSPMKKRPK